LLLLQAIREAASRRDEVCNVLGNAPLEPHVARWSLMSAGFVVVAMAALGVGVWVLHKVGRALASVAEALAAAAVVFIALWWVC
jgi:hypothetical protein